MTEVQIDGSVTSRCFFCPTPSSVVIESSFRHPSDLNDVERFEQMLQSAGDHPAQTVLEGVRTLEEARPGAIVIRGGACADHEAALGHAFAAWFGVAQKFLIDQPVPCPDIFHGDDFEDDEDGGPFQCPTCGMVTARLSGPSENDKPAYRYAAEILSAAAVRLGERSGGAA